MSPALLAAAAHQQHTVSATASYFITFGLIALPWVLDRLARRSLDTPEAKERQEDYEQEVSDFKRDLADYHQREREAEALKSGKTMSIRVSPQRYRGELVVARKGE